MLCAFVFFVKLQYFRIFALENKMYIYKMYWYFYRTTLSLNIGFSFCVTMLATFYGGNPVVWFPVCFATVGLLATLLYKEVVRPFEYYFYYNRGITKTKLFLFCWLVNILPASLFLILIYYVTYT